MVMVNYYPFVVNGFSDEFENKAFSRGNFAL